MRDIPFFTTENGIASLTLREIPYRKIAYILLQDTAVPAEFLRECLALCRMAGAERIYAAGHPFLEMYPLHTAIWQLSADREALPDSDAQTMPVTAQTLEAWRELYNRRMSGVPSASYMTRAEAEVLLSRGDGYFVHKDGQLLGLGIASGGRIDGVVSAVPGAGKRVVLALNRALSGEQVTLEVASANTRAVALYEALGFLKTAEGLRWYKIFDLGEENEQ